MDGLIAFLCARYDELGQAAQEADVDAKRRIVDHAEKWAATCTAIPEGWTTEGATAYRMAMEWTLRLLALEHADHPDYREEWRP